MRVVLLVALVVLAGCSGSGSGDEQEQGSSGVQEQKVTKKTDAPGAPGNLTGRVRDDVNYSLEGALVALLGTSLSGWTDADGRFRIEGVPPATYTIRVNPPGEYLPVEDDVTIGPGEDVEVIIVVLPSVDRGPGYRPHVHDHWRGETKYVMMDEAVDLRDEDNIQARAYQQYYGPNYSHATHCNYLDVHPRSDDILHPALVIQGTGVMRVTLEWDRTQVTADRLGLHYTPNGERQQETLAPVPPGTVMEIPVAATQWDSPHQAYTLWRFCINTGTALISGEPGGGPVLIQGPIHVRIELEKGSEPVLDPPHPDWWGDAQTLVYPLLPQGAFGFRLDKEQIVPPGTAVMEMRHEWTYTGTYGPLGAARNTPWELYWRSADMDPQKYGVDDYHTATPESCGQRCMLYVIELDPRQTDAYYQTTSNWQWAVEPPDTTGDPAIDLWLDLLHTLVHGGQHQVVITLHKG